MKKLRRLVCGWELAFWTLALGKREPKTFYSIIEKHINLEEKNMCKNNNTRRKPHVVILVVWLGRGDGIQYRKVILKNKKRVIGKKANEAKAEKQSQVNGYTNKPNLALLYAIFRVFSFMKNKNNIAFLYFCIHRWCQS